MNREIENYLKDITIEYFVNSKLGSKLENALSIFEKIQENITALIDKQGEECNIGLKAVTVMTFAILKKISSEKKLAEFDKQDWKEIANAVSEYAVLLDETQYVISVFSMYEKYIRASADYIATYAYESNVQAIRLLADEIQEKTVQLKNGQVRELDYIEQCLWISLEAMIKLIASSVSKFASEEYSELAHALAMYAFEYGRMSLYKQELELVNEFINSQYQLDEELKNKYDIFIKKLEMQSEQFMMLIDNAFSTGFREKFLGSIASAKAIGVSENEILVAIDDIDAFFMD